MIRMIKLGLLIAVVSVASANGGAVSSAKIPAAPTGWVSAVGDIANREWKAYGVHYVISVPGKSDVIAGVSGKGLWITGNSGVTWRQLSPPGTVGADPFYINFDPLNSDRFWVTSIHGSSIYKTTNGGETFEAIRSPGGETISVDFLDPDRRTLLTADHERNNTLQISFSSGRTWHSITDNVPPGATLMPNAFIYGDNTVISGSDSKARPGIFRSPDAGKTWQKVAPFVPGWRHARLGSKAGVIYWSGYSSGFLRSDDGGKTWANLGGPITAPPVEAANGMLVSYGGKQLYASTDGGNTWKPYGPPIPIEPWGITYNEKLRAFFVWRLSSTYDRLALVKWTP
jgi:photosystem II stability/assembly factor-like uncharacterized protein